MPKNEGRELLLHELKDMYDAEHKFAEALTTMIERTRDRPLTDGFRRHREVTRGQIRRLEQCFDEVGQRPQREECAGAKGLTEEYKSFVQKERPDAETHDLFAAGAALKVEHYEIVAYATMIDLALRLDLDECANLLTENLREEEATAAELEMASRKLGAELTGSSAGLRGAIGALRAPMRSGGIGAVARAVGHQAGDAVGRLEKRGRRARTTRAKAGSNGRRASSTRSTASPARKTTRKTTRRKSTARSTTNGRRSTAARTRATGSRSRTGVGRTRSTTSGTRASTTRARSTTRSTRRPASRAGSRTTARRTSRSTASRARGTRSRARSR
jgi:ferritin-like metal-binding protein YciE